jgi:hypothetical protein
MGHAAPLLMFVLALGPDAGVPAAASPGPDSPQRPRPPLNLLAPVVGGGADRWAAKPETYELRPSTDGSGDLLYDEAGFSVRIARDGAVKFRDRRVGMLGLLEPFLPKSGPRNVPSLFATINSLAHKRDIPQADDMAQTEDRYLIIPNQSRYRPDPREACRACERPVDVVLPGVAGRFDLSDELVRFSHQDPYRYQKAKFLAATRDRRVEMAAKAHAHNLERALAELPASLEHIACDDGRSRPERRAIIERLRDELDGASTEAHAAAETISRFLTQRFGASDAGVAGCAPVVRPGTRAVP